MKNIRYCLCDIKKKVLAIIFLQDTRPLNQNVPNDKEAERKDALNLIWDAHQDWVDACRFFEFAVDTELVDYSIHMMEATESRYQYLLRWARLNKITAFNSEVFRRSANEPY